MLNIYKSSAGSGKTYTLVREYLRIAFKDTEKYRSILAITFTNKAAAEMKTRILEALSKIASGKGEGLTQELCALCKKSEEELKIDANKILLHMLHHYSDISVCTIDSFVHRVVRSFTYDLHLPMNFNIEMDSEKLLNDAVNLLLDRLVESDGQITQAVVDFAEHKIEESSNWNVEKELVKLGNELFKDDALPFIDLLSELDIETLRGARSKLYAYKTSFENKLMDEGGSAMSLIENSGYSSRDFHQGVKGIYGFFERYSKGEIPKDPTGNSYVNATINDDKWGKGNVNETLKNQLKIHYEQIVKIYTTDAERYYLCVLLLKNFFSFILLTDIQKLLEEIKASGRVLHISDFHHKVLEIVREQDAPIIYERIGEKYDSILIDEFQDTSVVQWQNLLPLVENSQFKSEDSLVVGDGKQAIYRFRGGEVAQFDLLPDVYGSDHDAILKQREVAIKNYGTKLHKLEYNYRSRKEIVDFNNDLYKVLSDLPRLKSKSIYAGAAQKSGRNSEGGYVNITFLPNEKDSESGLTDLRNERVLEIIEDVIKRGYKYKDIAVLARTNRNASAIASFLLTKNIRVVSPESLLIAQSPKVNFVLSAMRYLNKREDAIARAELMHYMLFFQGRSYEGSTFQFPESPAEFEQLFNARSQFNFSAGQLQTGRLTLLVEQLIAVFKLDAHDPFLQFFSDEVLLFVSRYGNRIDDFLEWWERVKGKKSIIYPESMDAVRIMSIHKSKGLQFPVVILADAVETMKSSKKFFWVPLKEKFLPELHVGVLPNNKMMEDSPFAHLFEHENDQAFLDMLNLLYVGTTRPEDALYILSAKIESGLDDNKSLTSLFISYLREKQLWNDFESVDFGNKDYTNEDKKGKRAESINSYVTGTLEPRPGSSSSAKIKMDDTVFWSESTRQRMDKGMMLHEAFRRVLYRGDEEMVIDKMIRQGLIPVVERIEFITDLEDATNHPGMKPYFEKGPKIINERKILKRGEGVKIPDRVVIENNTATIIDYKSGEPLKSHSEQLEQYAHLLEEAGVSVNRKLLYYVNTKTVQEV